MSSELLKQELELRYWRTKDGAEVDFVLETGEHLAGIEVRAGR